MRLLLVPLDHNASPCVPLASLVILGHQLLWSNCYSSAQIWRYKDIQSARLWLVTALLLVFFCWCGFISIRFGC